jgi:hypothetical protein
VRRRVPALYDASSDVTRGGHQEVPEKGLFWRRSTRRRAACKVSLMKKRVDPASDLVAAAQAIENDLRRLEELSASVRKIKLHNEKSIGRAARELQQALEQQERLAQGLGTLGQAMMHLQQRQQAALEPLNTRAIEITERTKRMAEHMQRFGALGALAGEATQMLQSLPTPGTDGATNGASESDPVATLIEVDQRLGAVVDEAKQLAEAAQIDDFVEIAREADALRQRIHAIRGRLAQLKPSP